MKYVKAFESFIGDINEANKKVEKAIDNVIDNFDDEWHEYRYKDVTTKEMKKGQWYVNYITQEDQHNDGQEYLEEALGFVTEEFGVVIYLYYIIRDDADYNMSPGKSGRNVYTKIG